jgi:hypothetical protein
MGSSAHAPRGLMRAEWGRTELDRIQHGALKFSESEAAPIRASLLAANNGLGPISSSLLDELLRIGPAGLRAQLDAIRKPHLSMQDRQTVRLALPKQGEIRPSGKDARKLATIGPLLQYHQQTGTIQIKVIDLSRAFVGLYARSFILISGHALYLVDAEELKALAAHELAHDYFWDEYQVAKENHETQRVQEFELRCDAVAILTMIDLQLNPDKLSSALDKLNSFNAKFGVPTNANLYVTLQERICFIKKTIAILRSRGVP